MTGKEPYKKKAASYSLAAFITPGTGLSSQAVTHQVLSLLTVFTVVFGMGTGVFRSHEHQDLLGYVGTVFSAITTLGSVEIRPSI